MRLLTLSLFFPVPADFATSLQLYTKQGLRVIAAAYKSLNANTKFKDADDMPRLELEQKCEFLGLIIMQVNTRKKVIIVHNCHELFMYVMISKTAPSLLTE